MAPDRLDELRLALFLTQTVAPNVNFQCTTLDGTLSGGTFPCLINNYRNLQPSLETFDLSLGYDTGDDPVNDYLRRIGVPLVVQKHHGPKPSVLIPDQYRRRKPGHVRYFEEL